MRPLLYAAIALLHAASAANSGTSGCGDFGTYTDTSGFIKSHSTQGIGASQYAINRNCAWSIVAPTGYRIRLEFIGEIDIEEHNNCDYDYLSVFDGASQTSKELGTWCGRGSLPIVLSTGNRLYLRFVSDTETTAKGFRLKYEFFRSTVSGCNSTEFACTSNQCIQLNWKCDGETDCDNGNDEKNCPTSSICKAGESVCASGDQCISSDWECDGELDCKDGSDEQQCTCSSTQITCNNKRCVPKSWVCDGENDCGDNTDELKCTSTSLCASNQFQCAADRKCIPSSYKCDGDNDCYDNSDEKNCAAVATTPVAPALMSSTNCGSPAAQSGTAGTLTSSNYPNVYSSNALCTWTITVKAGQNVQLSFDDFQLESDSSSSDVGGSRGCVHDYVTIYESRVSIQTMIGRYCGTTKPSAIVSTSNVMVVQFKSDSIINKKGFKATWLAVTGAVVGSGCGGPRDLTATSGIITSHSMAGTQLYPASSCVWVIAPVPGKTVTLTFDTFSLEQSAGCTYDYLKVHLGSSEQSTLAGKYCGTTRPASITAISGLYIVFRADAITNSYGFKLSYNVQNTLITTAKPTIVTTTRRPVLTTANRVTVNPLAATTAKPAPAQTTETCGMPSSLYPTKVGTRIVGGTEANRHSWPWQAYITYNNYFTCGGSLIHPQWVLTAAHCLEDTIKSGTYWDVYLGKHTKASESGALKFDVSKIIEYPHYDTVTIHNDIALLKLSKPVTYSDKIKPICLPSTTQLPTNHRCYVTGWGDTKGTGFSSVLKQAVVPIMSKTVCNQRGWYDGDITDTMFCAGYSQGGHDACEGDSGGPLACEVNGRFVLEGVTSWGIGCALPNSPGVYAAVPKFINWIKETIANN